MDDDEDPGHVSLPPPLPTIPPLNMLNLASMSSSAGGPGYPGAAASPGPVELAAAGKSASVAASAAHPPATPPSSATPTPPLPMATPLGAGTSGSAASRLLAAAGELQDSPAVGSTARLLRQGSTNQSGPSASTPGSQSGVPATPGRLESLLVRVDQPVEGVEFQPHTLLRGVDGGVVSRRLDYNWLRSKTKRVCDEPSCGRQREPAIFQDIVTGRRYCCKQCYALDFHAARKAVAAGDAPPVPRDETRLRRDELRLDVDDSDHACWDVRPFLEDDGFIEVGRERTFTPTHEDVGHVLKLMVGAWSEDGKSTSVSTTSEPTAVVIGPPPEQPKRRHIPAHHVLMNPNFSDQTTLQFRAVTYNILAEIYATGQIFSYTPRWALSWKYRRVQILRELLDYSADVMCLQEVQQDHFQQYLMPALARKGFEGVYKAKTREAAGPQGKIDGCATIFRRDKFTLIETHEIEFNKIAYQMAQQGAFASGPNIAGQPPPPNDPNSQRCLKRLCRDNVAHVLVLEATGLNGEVEHVAVANVHIFWDPEYADVKLWQTHVLLQELEGITGPRQLPLVLCGDFNSTPDSAVTELLAQESVDPKHPDLAFDKLGVLPQPNQLTHTLGLVSAHAQVTGSEPAVTNLTSQFKGVLDYIFLNESLAAVACLDTPTEQELLSIDDTPLPNSVYPSDHIAICVDIRMHAGGGVGGGQGQQVGSHNGVY